MQLVVRDMSPAAVRHRLMNPENPVRDLGIDLKRKVIPILTNDTSQSVPVTSLDVFGPKLPSINDLAFGPIVHPRAVLWSYKIDDIQRIVAARYKISRLDLVSARRTHQVVKPRQVAMYLCRTITPRSLPEIGRRFGGRDHTTVMHAVKKIERLRNEDELLNAEVVELIETITEDEYRFL